MMDKHVDDDVDVRVSLVIVVENDLNWLLQVLLQLVRIEYVVSEYGWRILFVDESLNSVFESEIGRIDVVSQGQLQQLVVVDTRYWMMLIRVVDHDDDDLLQQ